MLACLATPLALAGRALAQSQSSLPTEDARQSQSVPAGPYSVVNTGTGSLITVIPLVHLSGPGGTALDFTLYHTSAGVQYSNTGQVARGWRHSYDDFIATNNVPNLSTFAQRNSAGGGLTEWIRSTSTDPYTRRPGVRDDLLPDPNGFYFQVKHKDQSVATSRMDTARTWWATPTCSHRRQTITGTR